VREFGWMMIGQEKAARAEPDILCLQKGLRENEIGRRMRLPGRGVMFADPGFLIAELVEPAQHLKIPVLAFLQSALRRMRRHRKVSEFHGVPLAIRFLCSAAHASLRATQSIARRAMRRSLIVLRLNDGLQNWRTDCGANCAMALMFY